MDRTGGYRLLSKIKAVIFDLGGTLINYEGFPHYWGDYYEQAFKYVSEKLNIKISDIQINTAIDSLKKFNPRLYPREFEYSPTYIFSDVFKEWELKDERFNNAIRGFFEFFQRNVIIYPDTIEVLEYLKGNGYKIGILTDVPTGMPTEIIIEDISIFKDKIDCFLSSIDCGFRKPNKKGIEIISESFGTDIKNIVFVGDEEKDVKAAKNAGAISFLINRDEVRKSYGEDKQIKCLAELTTFLKTVS